MKTAAGNALRSRRRLLAVSLTALGLLLGGSAAAAADGDPNMVVELVLWFLAPEQWQGSGGIPMRMLEHVWYVLLSMAAAVAIALPVGIGLGHTGRGGLLAINVSNIGRALPSLGIIILVFLLAGFGIVPVLAALIALAIPPMVTNSYVGMRSVDPAVRQSARAMGMTGWQMLRDVELPIALPLVMAGLRTSAVQVMSTATLAAYVGLGGLGRYLIDGLATRQLTQVVGGAIVVALLAIATELGLGWVQRRIVSQGLLS